MKIKLEFPQPCPYPETYLSESVLATHTVTKRAGISRDGQAYYYTLTLEPDTNISDSVGPSPVSTKGGEN